MRDFIGWGTGRRDSAFQRFRLCCVCFRLVWSFQLLLFVFMVQYCCWSLLVDLFSEATKFCGRETGLLEVSKPKFYSAVMSSSGGHIWGVGRSNGVKALAEVKVQLLGGRLQF